MSRTARNNGAAIEPVRTFARDARKRTPATVRHQAPGRPDEQPDQGGGFGQSGSSLRNQWSEAFPSEAGSESVTDHPVDISDMHYGNSLPQRTLKASIHCAGVGLHCGRQVHMTLHPGEVNDGVVFVRTDLPGGSGIVPATWDRVANTTLCTVLANENGATVGTIEHLMAALSGFGIDNAVIELDGPEVPIMDGSAAPFVFLIECAGIAHQAAARRAIRVLRRVEVREGGRSVSLSPGTGSSFSFEIDFPSAAVAHQEGYIRLSQDSFEADLARARTFGFLSEVESLRARGLALGGSLDNAIVVDGDAVLNPGGLRFEDEFVRHKLLDSIGDLYLAGAPIIGHFHGHRSGHALNHRLLDALFADDAAWCFDTARDPDQPHAGWIAGGLAQTA